MRPENKDCFILGLLPLRQKIHFWVVVQVNIINNILLEKIKELAHTLCLDQFLATNCYYFINLALLLVTLNLLLVSVAKHSDFANFRPSVCALPHTQTVC